MTTYTMNLYQAAPQHKRKLKYAVIERTLDFAKQPVDATFGVAQAWASGDKVEVVGIRANQIVVGVTVEVVVQTSVPGTISVGYGTDTTAFGTYVTRSESSAFVTGRIYPNKNPSINSSVPDPFFSPIQFATSDTIDVTLGAAFTSGIIKINVHVLEEDRA